MKLDCDQCHGTGTAGGHRCPCREEDDKARALRSRMGIVGKSGKKEPHWNQRQTSDGDILWTESKRSKQPPTKAAPDAGQYKPPPQTRQRLGKHPQAQKPRMYRTQLFPNLPDEVND